MPLKWGDFDFEKKTLLIQRSIVHGREDATKTEYSRDQVPLDDALVSIILEHKKTAYETEEGWVFPNPETGRPYHQDSIQQDNIRNAGKTAGLGDGIGWKVFRHSYRAWMDKTHAPVSVQKELMRHASIQTTMNVYGKAMTDDKRKAHSKVVEMLLGKPKQTEAEKAVEEPLAATGS